MLETESTARSSVASAALRPYTRADFDHSPLVVFYEITRACDLVCKHCRACAQPQPDPAELSTASSLRLLEQLASFPKPPLVVFTGGDPLKRADVFELVRGAVRLGLEAAMTPSATPLVTRGALAALRDAGLSRLAVSLDGADAATHDALRGVPGSFQRTLDIMADARGLGLPLQVNTTITQANVDQVDAMAALLAGQGIVLWSVFFLVPVGRGQEIARIAPEQYEEVFGRLWRHAQTQPYGIKTTEAPHFRRFVLARRGNPQRAERRGGKGDESNLCESPDGPLRGKLDSSPSPAPQRAPLGANDGRGVMFVGHGGEIFPSGFLPISCGRFPLDSVVDVYQKSMLFVALRDPDRLGGKCGQCEFRQACGGSRARAYAISGDPLAAEPDCLYLPAAWNPAEAG